MLAWIASCDNEYFSGDFILAAHHFGVAHPPGYPLYVTFGYLWIKIFPFGSPAFKLNLVTSFIGGLAAWIVYITTYKLVPNYSLLYEEGKRCMP